MTHFPVCRSALLLAVAFGFGLMAMPAAHAFTVENQDSNGASNMFLNGTAPSADPDDKITSGFGNGQSTYKSGNSTIQFGARPSFDQRYNPSNLMNRYNAGSDHD
jgi:hypothetical protein